MLKKRKVDISDVQKQAINNIEINAKYDKDIDSTKPKIKVVRFSLGDFVLHKNEKRNQTKLDPKFKSPIWKEISIF